MKSIELLSPHPPAACASRLLGAIDSEKSGLFSMAGLFGKRPVLGRASESSLRLRKRISGRNSFQNVFLGSMQPSGGVTLISGKFSVQPFVRVFMAIWFCGDIILGVPSSIMALWHLFSTGGAGSNDNWMLGFVPLLMVCFGVALVAIGRYCARNEASFIAGFLTETLDAIPNERNTEPGAFGNDI